MGSFSIFIELICAKVLFSFTYLLRNSINNIVVSYNIMYINQSEKPRFHYALSDNINKFLSSFLFSLTK